MGEQPKRQTAVKLAVRDILEATYLVKEGWEPNVLQTKYGEASRVNVIGVVVSKESDKPVSFILEDGTGQIQVRSLDENLPFTIEAGKIVVCIGRPRQFQNQRFLNPEIVREVTDPCWVEIRKRELASRTPTVPQPAPIPESDNRITGEDAALALIRKQDEGNGVSVQSLLESSAVAEPLIDRLLQKGEIFEVKPGRVKVLE